MGGCAAGVGGGIRRIPGRCDTTAGVDELDATPAVARLPLEARGDNPRVIRAVVGESCRMRRIRYGGSTLVTSDSVATALLQLTAGVAAVSGSVIVTIPAVQDRHEDAVSLDLIIGAGIPVLSEPWASDQPEPDFSDTVAWLQLHPDYPHASVAEPVPVDDEIPEAWDPDLDGQIEAY